MIVPSKNQKTYGVLHTEGYFSFLGFCKKVNSDEIQKVDVYLDDILLDTIIADKHLQKIEDIYELDGFGFSYNMPEEYIGQKSLISFKNHETQENLQNSPFELSDKSHPKFNEMKFINCLFQPINKKNIKDKFSPNCVGFLANEENMKNKEFIKYIKELYKKFPQLNFKSFYFNDVEKNTIENIFVNEMNRIKLILPKNAYNDIANEIEIFIDIDGKVSGNLVKGVIKYNKNIILVLYPDTEKLINTPLSELPSIDEEKYKLLQKLGVSNNIIKKCNDKFIVAAWDNFFTNNNINYDFNHDMGISEYFTNILELSLMYPECKKYLVELNYLYYKMDEE